jgi:YVTN family beta-propeller protein
MSSSHNPDYAMVVRMPDCGRFIMTDGIIPFRTLACCLLLGTSALAQKPGPLRLVASVPMPQVEGRIDHMALDVAGQRLFVAALGNNTLEVIDVKNAKHLRTIPGLHEPQGVAYTRATNRIYVANRADGSLLIYDGSSLALLKTIAYGRDADNVRYDAQADRLWVGYGEGGLGAFDQSGAKLREIALGAHPESFQLEAHGSRIFINLPPLHTIAVVDRQSGKVTASWPTAGAAANYPMALDETDHRLFVISRRPARLLVFDTSTGKLIASFPVVGDSDDAYYDAARKRIYVIGGEGAISVFDQQDADHYRELERIPTAAGARTGYFSAELRRLFVAARRRGSQPAEIRIYEVD